MQRTDIYRACSVQRRTLIRVHLRSTRCVYLSTKRNIRNECAILIRRVKGMLREECGYAPRLTLRHWMCICRWTRNRRPEFSTKNVQAPPKRDTNLLGWKRKRFFRFFPNFARFSSPTHMANGYRNFPRFRCSCFPCHAKEKINVSILENSFSICVSWILGILIVESQKIPALIARRCLEVQCTYTHNTTSIRMPL